MTMQWLLRDGVAQEAIQFKYQEDGRPQGATPPPHTAPVPTI
jgi:hypothetical protein